MSSSVRCQNCGREWPEELEMRLCGHCGKELERQTPEIAEKERRTLTVLFADLTRFSSFSEGKDPEKVEEVLVELFDRLGRVIEDYNGYVDKYMGDAVMAVFGAPEAHEHDTISAVRAGLELIEKIKEFTRERGGGDLALRVGINRGETIWSRVGGGDYTVTGDAVNVAKRLESAADPNTVLVSRSVQKRTRKRIEYGQRNSLLVKGREARVQPYVAVEEKEYHDPYRDTAGVTASIRGREEELSRLISSHESDGPSFVAITGEAGIGKSRLAWEFRNYLVESPGITILGTVACSQHAELPLEPFGNLLLRKAETGRADPEAGRKVAEAIVEDFQETEHGEIQRENFAHLMALSIGLDVPDARVKELPADRLQEEMQLAWGTWCQKRADENPVVLVVEDLQWADDPTRNLMKNLVEQFSAPRHRDKNFMLLTTSRPEDNVPDSFEEIALSELDRDECRSIAEEVLDRPIAEDMAKFLIEHSGGNPYFLEELLRYLLEKELLEENEGMFEIAEAGTKTAVPDTLNGLLVGRIDQLPANEKETVKGASVIGRNFWLRLLEEILERSAREEVKSLSGREMVFRLEESDIPGDREYTFKHALLRDAAYRLLPKKNRRKLHALLSSELEEIATSTESSLEKGGEPVNRGILSLAAQHAKASGDKKRAGDLWVRAAESAREEYALEEALEYAHAARRTPRRSDALRIAARAYTDLSRYEKAATAARTVLEEFPEEKENANFAELTLARITKSRGNFKKALSRANRVLQSDPKGDIQLFAMNGKGTCLFRMMEYDAAYSVFQECLSIAKRFEEHRMVAKIHNNIGLIHFRRAESEEALSYFEDALEICREHGDRIGRAGTLNNIGLIYIDLGEQDKALEKFRESLEICNEIGNRRNVAFCHDNIGIIHMKRGNFDRALEIFQTNSDLQKELGDRRSKALNQNHLGIVHRERGDYETARSHFLKAREVSRELGTSNTEFTSLIHLSILELHLATVEQREVRGDKLETYLSEAEGAAGKTQNPSNLIYLNLLRARWKNVEGNLQEAREMLRTAQEQTTEAGNNPDKDEEYLKRLAEVERAAGNEEKAGRAAETLLEIARNQGRKPLEARALYLAGRPKKARKIAEEIGLQSLLDRIEAEKQNGGAKT